jgi:hypothetical protein
MPTNQLDLLEIRDLEAKISFSRPSHDSDGWLESYFVEISMPGVSANVSVDDAPYAQPITQFFAELASSWRGWKGERIWRSLEGEYNLVASCDSSGHIILSANLGSRQIAPCWKATVSIMIEAGQLDRIYQEVKEFFSQR